MIGKKCTVQRECLLFADTHTNIDSRGTHALYSATADHAVVVGSGNDYTRDSAVYYEVGTRGSLSIVRAGFETDIDCRAAQQRRVAHRAHGINLGVRLAATYVVALAYYFAVAHNDRAHHRVGRSASAAVARKLQAA